MSGRPFRMSERPSLSSPSLIYEQRDLRLKPVDATRSLSRL